MSALVRRHARWVVPVATPPIANGTVVTDGERITWVGPRANAPVGGQDEELGDCILTPGLVNAHTHLDLTMMRGALEDLTFFEWVRTLTRAKRELLTDDDFRAAALLGAAEGLSRGITTFGDTSDNDAAFDALLTLGARGIAYREVFGADPAQVDASIAGLTTAIATMRLRATPLVRLGVSPHAPYSVSDALFVSVREFADREGLPLAVHIAESAAEDDLVIRASGPFAEFLRARGLEVERRASGPIQLIDAAGLLRQNTLLIHCVRVAASDVARIADTGCGIAHCPTSNAKLGHGVAPLREFLATGARVGLGSDSMASNNTMDLLAEARLAVLQQRAITKTPDALPARAAFRLATLGGAEALRLDDEIGSLVPGKQADLAAFRVSDLGLPAEDPLAALVFGAGQVVAHRVIIAGRERVRDGVVTDLDPGVPARVRAAALRLTQWRSARAAL